MIASIRDGSWGFNRVLLSAAMLAGLAACATTTNVAPAQAPAGGGELADVVVARDGDATVITLVGIHDPVYTTFEREEPSRLVVDLTAVRLGRVTPSVPVYDGVVEEVRLSPFQTGGDSHTRVEVALVSPAQHEVGTGPDGLEIRVFPMLETAGAITEEMSEAEANPDEASVAEPLAMTLEDEVEPQGPAATKLTGIQAEEVEGGTRIRLLGDGAFDKVETFAIEDPDRLVIDLWGIAQTQTPARIEVGTPHAARVRVGQHSDKVRVVIDGGDTTLPFQDFQTVAQADGMVIALGMAPEAMPEADPAGSVAMVEAANQAETPPADLASPAEDTPAEASPVPAWSDEPTPGDGSEGRVRVYGVQLDSQPERERVVVLSDAPVQHELVNLDAETLVVRMHGATIDPEAAVRLAPPQAGPVSMVTAFQQPEVAIPEVRVVVKRAAGIEPQVSRQGTMLFMDFPRSGGVARTLPLYEKPTSGAMAPGTTAPAGAATKAMAQAHAALAPQVPAAIDPDAGIDLLAEGGLVDGKQYMGRRISLDFKDVDIDDVLRLIADVSDLNVIAGDDVEGKVTIRLVDVPWDQALDVILLTKGLGFVRVGNVLRIAPVGVLKAEEEARLQERRAKEKLEDLVVKLQPVNYASVKEVSKMVKRLLTPRGTVDVDERTNTIILKDIASVIAEATALIKAIDTQTPQVLIEAKIVEARLDFSREIGSTWAFGLQPLNDAWDPASGERRDLDLGRDFVFHDTGSLTGFTDTFNHVQVANPITSLANGLLDMGAFILDDQFNLELRLEAAESNGDGKVISSPRVVTLDNREAEIEQGVSIPFQTFENGDAQLEFIDAVLKLKVTPHITADRSIIMKVEVERNAPDDSVQTPTGSPAIAKNEAKTETLVKDGQTLVIGGIYVIQKADRSSGVPFFNKIPILGAAFRNIEVRDQRNELLIFVTPRIVVNPEVAS